MPINQEELEREHKAMRTGVVSVDWKKYENFKKDQIDLNGVCLESEVECFLSAKYQTEGIRLNLNFDNDQEQLVNVKMPEPFPLKCLPNAAVHTRDLRYVIEQYSNRNDVVDVLMITLILHSARLEISQNGGRIRFRLALPGFWTEITVPAAEVAGLIKVI